MTPSHDSNSTIIRYRLLREKYFGIEGILSPCIFRNYVGIVANILFPPGAKAVHSKATYPQLTNLQGW